MHCRRGPLAFTESRRRTFLSGVAIGLSTAEGNRNLIARARPNGNTTEVDNPSRRGFPALSTACPITIYVRLDDSGRVTLERDALYHPWQPVSGV